MSRGPDASTMLERALIASAAAAHCPVEVQAAGCTRWASATFAGMRHEIVLGGVGTPALERWLSDLPEAEFALRGHLVADVSVESVRRADGITTATIEILTVEER